VILLLYLAISPLDGNHIRFFQQYTFVAWVGVGFNLIAFNFITILGVITLVEHLNRYFLKEQKLQMELKKEKEDLMVARARAEESDRLKTAFLANMSHEIRTPMNGILGFAGLLRDPELEPDEQERYLSIIKRSGERMLNILNNIIDISKIEAGISTLSVTPVYVIEVMRQVELLFIPLAQEKRLKLTFYQGLSDTESNILTDEEKLFSILANLVKNAIQFSDTGEITVTCKLRTELQPHENSALKFLDFLVKDQGICIPEDRQEAIFERFITADIANRQARAGAGLGLALVKAYIEMLHGQISVESTPGAGTVFRFSIPVLPNNVTNNISA
jgi:signal transduction histidine kinase